MVKAYLMMISRSLLGLALACGLAILGSAAAPAQDTPQQEKSLGEVAREAKKTPTTKAKVVVTDDSTTLKSHSSTIPAIFKDGIDNSDEIIAAILAYRTSHTPDETASAVHAWYDENDARLQAAIEENKRIESAVQPTYTTPEAYQAALAERRHDLQQYKENGLLMARIQGTFMKVRGGIMSKVQCPWFKIRCGNGNCSF